MMLAVYKNDDGSYTFHRLTEKGKVFLLSEENKKFEENWTAPQAVSYEGLTQIIADMEAFDL